MQLTDIKTIKDILARHDFHFSKALGQNFLINPGIAPKMAAQCGADKDTCALEIGPGIGVLTRELAAVAKKVVAVELDTRLLPVLDETLADCENAKVVHGDALKIDLHKIIKEEFGGGRTVVCANLPYYITSPVIMHLLESGLAIDALTVMVQKEAAQRICANPGTRESGAISVAVHYRAQPKLLFPVSRGSFIPAPNVDSAVIRLDLHKTPPVDVADETVFFGLVKAAFSQRRKMLTNTLSGFAGLSKPDVAALLNACGIKPTARAEELTLAQFAALANAVRARAAE